ncbi:MAG: hypothetical protein ACK5TP_02440, partial [bacterium]
MSRHTGAIASELPLVRLGQGAFTRDIWPEDLDPSIPKYGVHMPPATLMNQISKGRKAQPRRVMLYGTHGSGKSLSLIHISEPTRIQSISYAGLCW